MAHPDAAAPTATIAQNLSAYHHTLTQVGFVHSEAPLPEGFGEAFTHSYTPHHPSLQILLYPSHLHLL